MGKVTRYDNFELIVEVEDPWGVLGKTHDEKYKEKMLSQLNAVKQSILRHVDGVQNIVTHYVKKDVCEYCESRWEEGKDGVPLCCDLAQKEWAHKTGLGVCKYCGGIPMDVFGDGDGWCCHEAEEEHNNTHRKVENKDGVVTNGKE